MSTPPPKTSTSGPFSAGFSEEQVQFASATVQSRVMESLTGVVLPDDEQSLEKLQEIARSLDPGMDHAVRDALNTAADTAHARAAGLVDLPYCSDELIRYIASSSFRAELPRTLQRTVSQVMEPAIDHLESDAPDEPQLRGLVDRATLNASFEIAQQSTRTVAEAVVEAVVEATTKAGEPRSERGDRHETSSAPMGDDEPSGYDSVAETDPAFTW